MRSSNSLTQSQFDNFQLEILRGLSMRNQEGGRIAVEAASRLLAHSNLSLEQSHRVMSYKLVAHLYDGDYHSAETDRLFEDIYRNKDLSSDLELNRLMQNAVNRYNEINVPFANLANYNDASVVDILMSSTLGDHDDSDIVERTRGIYERLWNIQSLRPLMQVMANEVIGYGRNLDKPRFRIIATKTSLPRITNSFSVNDVGGFYNVSNNQIYLNVGVRGPNGVEYSDQVLAGLLAHEMHHAWEQFRYQNNTRPYPPSQRNIALDDMLREVAEVHIPDSSVDSRNTVQALSGIYDLTAYNDSDQDLEIVVRTSQAIATLCGNMLEHKAIEEVSNKYHHSYNFFAGELREMQRWNQNKNDLQSDHGLNRTSQDRVAFALATIPEVSNDHPDDITYGRRDQDAYEDDERRNSATGYDRDEADAFDIGYVDNDSDISTLSSNGYMGSNRRDFYTRSSADSLPNYTTNAAFRSVIRHFLYDKNPPITTGVGLDCDAVRDSSGQIVAFDILSIMSPENRRFNVDISLLQGAKITHICKDNSNIPIAEVFAEHGEEEGVKFISYFFHSEGMKNFVVNNNLNVSCNVDKSSVYVTDQEELFQSAFSDDQLAGMQFNNLHDRDPILANQIYQKVIGQYYSMLQNVDSQSKNIQLQLSQSDAVQIQESAAIDDRPVQPQLSQTQPPKYYSYSSVDQPVNFTVRRVHAYNISNLDRRNNAANVRINCPYHIVQAFRNIVGQCHNLIGASYNNPYNNQIEHFPDDPNLFTARHLHILARNESVNTTGSINTGLYNGILTEDQIARIRCLVKFTTVSAAVDAYQCGGLGECHITRFDSPQTNIVIDQSGFQWQADLRNTGGMFFYPQNPSDPSLPAGYNSWQNDMFADIYGQDRPSQHSSNVKLVSWDTDSGIINGFLDLNLISMAISFEFLQALESANNQANLELGADEKINFRFLKAGMGVFADGVGREDPDIRTARLLGIRNALQHISEMPENRRNVFISKVARMDLPYSNVNPAIANEIGCLCESIGIEWGGTPAIPTSAFTPSQTRAGVDLVNATTNCGNPHVMPGNEGVDTMIARNANVDNLNAIFNSLIQTRSPQLTLPHIYINNSATHGFGSSDPSTSVKPISSGRGVNNRLEQGNQPQSLESGGGRE